MAAMKKICSGLIAVVLAAVVAGCSTHLSRAELQEKYLPFLQVGKTTKEEVLLNLGTPSGQFQNERILTYRLTVLGGKQLKVLPRESIYGDPNVAIWSILTKYNLIVVFDEKDVLTKYNVIDIVL
jgi:hypothetical protein